MPNIKSARRIYLLSGFVFAIITFLVMFEGVAIFAYYQNKGCDPLESGRIDSTNQLIPLAVSDLFSNIPGLPGLFVAALSSAALSTLSSSLSSLGAVTYDDIIREKFPDLADDRATKLCKIIVFLYGMLAMTFTALITFLPGTILNVTYALMGCVNGPTCAIFLMSLMYKKTSTCSLVVGALAGMACILWINIGKLTGEIITTPPLPPASNECCFNETVAILNSSFVCSLEAPYYNITVLSNSYPGNKKEWSKTFIQKIYSLSYTLYSLLGCTISMLVSFLVSALTSPPTNFDERCLFSFRKHILQDLFGMKTTRKNGSLNRDECTSDFEMDPLFLQQVQAT